MCINMNEATVVKYSIIIIIIGSWRCTYLLYAVVERINVQMTLIAK